MQYMCLKKLFRSGGKDLKYVKIVLIKDYEKMLI